MALYHNNRNAFVEELRQACHTVGFFLLKHNFPKALADSMLEESRQFFQRPLSEKLQISYQDSPAFRGYMQLGVENTGGKLDYREQIEYAVEYPSPSSKGSSSSPSSSKGGWPVYERLKSERNPWPDNYQPTFRPTTLEYAKHVCNVADCIRDALCLALDLDPKILSDRFHHPSPNELPHWVIKMISYPPAPSSAEDVEDDSQLQQQQQQQQQGVGAHTDTNFLTLVLQDNVGGLQAVSQGEWWDVPTNGGSEVLVCNLGEQAEIWSRGYFLATPHRVLRNASTQHRISVPLFYNPILSATLDPLEETSSLLSIAWDRPQNYHHDHYWRRDNNNAMLPTVGDNTFKSLARSHPDVFQRHHGDLILLDDGRIVLKDDSEE